MPHQWLEGNLPVSAKCTVCDKTCGSVLRLQDWRCLWCKAMVSERRGPRPSPEGGQVPCQGAPGVGCEGGVAPRDHGLLLQVHTACKESLLTRCPLGLCKVSVIPPTALNSIDSDGKCHMHASLSPFSCFSLCVFPSPTLALAVLVILRCGWEEVRPSRRGERSYVHRW